jgi:hypothetical protein
MTYKASGGKRDDASAMLFGGFAVYIKLGGMTRTSIAALSVLVAAGTAWAVYALPSGELITVEGRRDVPLYDPNTLAGAWGSRPIVLGTLGAGEKLQVVGCNDRKSDIDIHVSYRGAVAALGGRQGDFVLNRKIVSFWDAAATNSCRGFFGSFNNAT